MWVRFLRFDSLTVSEVIQSVNGDLFCGLFGREFSTSQLANNFECWSTGEPCVMRAAFFVAQWTCAANA